MNFKYLFLDIDGVMTDGTKVYDVDGHVIAKRYNDKDFTAINIFKELGIYVAFVSGDLKVNNAMAISRKIDFFFSRDEKVEKINSVIKEDWEHTAYCGDDLFDTVVFKKVKYPFCPSDAPSYVNCFVPGSNICNKKGGEGVVSDILSMYIMSNNIDIESILLEKL